MPELSENTKLFLRVHKYHMPTKWQWVLGGATLRVTTMEGIVRSAGAHELNPLFETGCIARSGGAKIYLTGKGNALV